MEFISRKQGKSTILEINDAQITWRNFEGRGDKYNREGDRNFVVIIPNEEIAEALQNDVNEYGVGWNVKIRPARDEFESPFMFLKVKVKFNSRGPAIYLKTGDNVVRLNEDTVGCLDNIDIASVDLDVRSYDDIVNGNPCRAAYLQAIHVTQNVDRFGARYQDRFDDEY